LLWALRDELEVIGPARRIDPRTLPDQTHYGESPREIRVHFAPAD
jgi:hypothetical protein